jgi:hypothetical protein
LSNALLWTSTSHTRRPRNEGILTRVYGRSCVEMSGAVNQGLALLGAWAQLFGLLLLLGYFLLRGRA